jgi:signal transduction histidine kinase
MSNRFDLSLRSRLLLLVLLGVVLPLGLLGLFVNNSAQRTGVELVHTRLQEALAETVEEFGHQWIQKRSLLLDLAESHAVVAALDGTEPWGDRLQGSGRNDINRLWSEVSSFLVFLELKDLEGELVGRLPDALGPTQPGMGRPLGTLDHVLPVVKRFSGEELGTMEARFRVDGLLPPGFLALGVAGSIPGIFDSRSGTSLAPSSMDAPLFSRSEFSWRGENWVAEDRVLEDPPLRFALVAPTEPVTAPFDRAAQRGGWAILLAVFLSFALVTVFARRLMRPLDRLAEAANAVASGDLTARAEESGPPGIRDTARAFNSMGVTLSRTLKQLSQKESIAAVGEFAADLAHEVRNPLTAIRTDLQRAQRKAGSEPELAADLVDRAVGAVDRLNATVSDFLEVARSGNVSLVLCDLNQPLKTAVKASEPQREAKGCVLQFEAPPGPVMVWADGDAIQRLALNILLNAVEAVEPGTSLGIRIREGDLKASVAVEFWDEGPGVPEELREKIFDPFETTKAGGTGLGLAISRRIAQGHGSDLTLEEGSVGTVFRFELRSATQ